MCCCVYMRFAISSSHNILHLIPEWIWLLATLTGTEISSPNLQLQICSGRNVCPALICNHAWFNPRANLHWPPHTIPPRRCPWNVCFLPSSMELWLEKIGPHLDCLPLSNWGRIFSAQTRSLIYTDLKNLFCVLPLCWILIKPQTKL